MTPLQNRLAELRWEIQSNPIAAGESRMADHLTALCDIVQAIAKQVEDAQETARRAANIASCLANGIKED